jgi:diadenosine tetraphosphate (Ap4A) HIT family hydrolase
MNIKFLVLVLLVCPRLEGMEKAEAVQEVPFAMTVGRAPFGDLRVTYMNPARTNPANPPAEAAKKDHFCAPEFKTNNIIVTETDVASLILNLAPYSRVGYHFLWIPKQHRLELAELTEDEFEDLTATMRNIDSAMRLISHEVRYEINSGYVANVPHLHVHIITHPYGPKPLHEAAALIPQAQADNKAWLNTLKDQVLPLLAADIVNPRADVPLGLHRCRPCWFTHLNQAEDEAKLIVYRDPDFIVLLPPSQEYEGQVAIIPVKHYESVRELDEVQLAYLMRLVQVVTPLVVKTTNDLVRLCTGSNVDMTSFGDSERLPTEYNHLICQSVARTPTLHRTGMCHGAASYKPYDPRVFAATLRAALAQAVNQ